MQDPAVIEFNKKVGGRIKERRLYLGQSQTDVSKALNITFQQVQKYEKGLNGCSARRIFQLGIHLNVPITYFFEPFSADVRIPQMLKSFETYDKS